MKQIKWALWIALFGLSFLWLISFQGWPNGTVNYFGLRKVLM